MDRGIDLGRFTRLDAIDPRPTHREGEACQLAHIVGSVRADSDRGGHRIHQNLAARLGPLDEAGREQSQHRDPAVGRDAEQRVPCRIGHDALARQGQGAGTMALALVTSTLFRPDLLRHMAYVAEASTSRECSCGRYRVGGKLEWGNAKAVVALAMKDRETDRLHLQDSLAN